MVGARLPVAGRGTAHAGKSFPGVPLPRVPTSSPASPAPTARAVPSRGCSSKRWVVAISGSRVCTGPAPPRDARDGSFRVQIRRQWANPCSKEGEQHGSRGPRGGGIAGIRTLPPERSGGALSGLVAGFRRLLPCLSVERPERVSVGCERHERPGSAPRVLGLGPGNAVRSLGSGELETIQSRHSSPWVCRVRWRLYLFINLLPDFRFPPC